jgi:uncharacterized membrane protein
MDVLMIVLRLIHIVTAIFWGGTAFFMVSFLTPAVQAAGPEGGKVMQRLVLSSFPKALPGIASLSVLSGLWMYWLKSGGLQLVWITTPTGLGFTFGGLMGLVALGIGLFVTVPAMNQLAAFAKQAMASGKPPTPEQMKALQGVQMKMLGAAVWNAGFLALGAAAMATARYW